MTHVDDASEAGDEVISAGRSLLLLASGLALGGVVVVLEQRGVGSGPAVLSLLVLALGAAAAVLPLERALFIVAVLAGFQQFFVDFLGGPGRYWKELFVAGLIVRALKRKPLSEGEIAFAAFTAAALIGYLLLGSTPGEVVWGTRILVIYALAGWALYRLGVSARAWTAFFAGVAIVVAANFVIALWQQQKGVDGLLSLGLTYGGSVREAAGSLRAYGAFYYAAPFAYTMAAAILIWGGFALTGMRRLAMVTVWVPLLAFAGIALSLNRLSLFALAAAAVVVAAARGRLPTVLAGGAVAALLVVSLAGSAGAQFLGEGLALQSSSADARALNWSERFDAITVKGEGPGSAGVAVERLKEAAPDPNEEKGVVDNQYVAWLVQYGVFGGTAIIVIWAIVLLGRAVVTSSRSPMVAAGQLLAIFAAVGAMGVNIWEEHPMNLFLAITMGAAASAAGRERVARAEPATRPPQGSPRRSRRPLPAN
jgi:hypothetical protein